MSSEFRPFNPRGPLGIRRRRLPHWEQPGATYFVTFRLADSLPRETVLRLAELRSLNPGAHGAGVPARLSARAIEPTDDPTFEKLDHHLDAGIGSCLLADPTAAEIAANSLRHFDGSRYLLGAFVVMPNHVHALVQPREGFDLTHILHAWKSFSARELQHQRLTQGEVWQAERFDRIVRNEIELREYHDYIVENPRAARLAAGRFLMGFGTAPWTPK